MRIGRTALVAVLFGCALMAHGEGLPKKVLLVPIDDRPATTQFASGLSPTPDVRMKATGIIAQATESRAVSLKTRDSASYQVAFVR